MEGRGFQANYGKDKPCEERCCTVMEPGQAVPLGGILLNSLDLGV